MDPQQFSVTPSPRTDSPTYHRYEYSGSTPLRRVVNAEHPQMVATTLAIVEQWGAGQGLLYPYLPDESSDGLVGHAGAFLPCSIWFVDNLAKQGRLDEAMELSSSLCVRTGTLRHLPDEIDTSTDSFSGHYPQAFSHIGVIARVNLARLLNQSR